MSTFNGVGTLYYDWQSNGDGTANATKWFVVFFLPVIPIQRERLRVLRTEKKQVGILETVVALTGNGTGFEATIEVLGNVPISFGRILRTYLFAYLGIPTITFMLPILLLVALMLLIEYLGMNVQQFMSVAFPIFGILLCIWVGVVVATILDRCAGRKHVARQFVDN